MKYFLLIAALLSGCGVGDIFRDSPVGTFSVSVETADDIFSINDEVIENRGYTPEPSVVRSEVSEASCSFTRYTDGTTLHRVTFDSRVRHQYQLVTGAVVEAYEGYNGVLYLQNYTDLSDENYVAFWSRVTAWDGVDMQGAQQLLDVTFTPTFMADEGCSYTIDDNQNPEIKVFCRGRDIIESNIDLEELSVHILIEDGCAGFDSSSSASEVFPF